MKSAAADAGTKPLVGSEPTVAEGTSALVVVDSAIANPLTGPTANAAIGTQHPLLSSGKSVLRLCLVKLQILKKLL